MMTLKGEKSYLQEFTEDRLEDGKYVQWLRDLDVVNGIYRFEYLLPLSEKEIIKYARDMMVSQTDYFFSIHYAENKDFIGTIKLGHIDLRTGIADVGIVIGEKDYWGKGIAVDAVRTICKHAFSNLSLRKLTGGTAEGNMAMNKCFLSVGFRQEAVLRKKLLIDGEYSDHILYGLFRAELK